MYFRDSFEICYTNFILLIRDTPMEPLDVKPIKKYKQSYKVKILPVVFDVKSQLFKLQEEILFMFGAFFKNEDYKKLD